VQPALQCPSLSESLSQHKVTMAPHNKRAASSPKKAGAGKRAKVQVVDETIPPALRARLEPIFGALAEADCQQKLPEACREMLKQALPFCVAEHGEERHEYQCKVLALVSDAFSQVEAAKRADVEAGEQKVASLTSSLETAKAELEAAEADATKQKGTSDEQGKTVKEKEAAEKAAEQALEAAKKAVQDFHTKKAQMESEIETFGKVFEELWKPLLEGHFPGPQWRKRDKMVVEFVKALEPVHMEASLIEAITTTLKTKTDQRGAFANLALTKAGEKLSEYKEKLTSEFAALDVEEQACQQTVATATSTLEAATADKKKEDEEHITLQNNWVDADNKAFNARKAVDKYQGELQAAEAEASTVKQSLDSFQGIQSQVKALNEAPPPEPTAPEASPQKDQQEASPQKDIAMSPASEAPVAVAAC